MPRESPDPPTSSTSIDLTRVGTRVLLHEIARQTLQLEPRDPTTSSIPINLTGFGINLLLHEVSRRHAEPPGTQTP